ncbi:MAG: prenyltransferase [Methanomicrobiales archaeon]
MNKKQLIALIKLSRPFVLVAGLIAYALGLAIAFYYQGYLDISESLIGLFILISATFMAHYANEYADVDTDTITQRTLYSGGSGILPSGIVPPEWALYSAILLAIITIIFTIISYNFDLLPVQGVIIVILGMLGGWFYSMPPLRLERTVLGEIDNALLGGYLMPLIAFIPQIGYVNLEVFLILTPIFLAVFINLLAVHWADRKADAMVGKNTMAVQLGSYTKYVHGIFTLLIYAITLLLINIIPITVVITIFSTLPLAFWAIHTFNKKPQFSVFLMAGIMIFASIGFLIA